MSALAFHAAKPYFPAVGASKRYSRRGRWEVRHKVRHETENENASAPVSPRLAGAAEAQGASPSVAGLWRTAGDEGLIRIEACGTNICGRIASDALAGDRSAQTNTHDGSVDGLLILKLKPTGPDRWGDGWIVNPDNGKHYHASVTLVGGNRLRLRGCLVVPLCQSQIWTRADLVAKRGGSVRPGL